MSSVYPNSGSENYYVPPSAPNQDDILPMEQVIIPSAPMAEGDSVEKTREEYDFLRPNDLPKASLKTSLKAKRVGGVILTALGVILAGAAVTAAIAFTASPAGVITVVTVLAVAAITAVVVGIVLSKSKPSLEDPKVLKEERQKVAEDIKNNTYTYREIKEKYPDVKVLNNEGINAHVRKEIQEESYQSFVQKRGVDIVDILDSENKENLKNKFLIYIKDPMNGLGLIQIRNMDVYSKFDLKMHDFCYELAENEKNKSYEQFKQRNGSPLVKYLNADAKKDMREKYLELSFQEMQEFKPDRFLLNISETEIKEVLAKRWMDVSMLQLVKSADFRASISEGVFTINEWKGKAAEDAAKIAASTLIKEYPEMLHYLAFGDVQKRLEDEILKAQKFEEISDSVFFRKGFLTQENTHVVHLSTQFVKKRAERFITQETLDANERLVLNYSLLPKPFLQKLGKASLQYKPFIQVYNVYRNEKTAEFEKTKLVYEAIRDLKIKELTERLAQAKRPYEAKQREKIAAEKRCRELESTISAGRAKLNQYLSNERKCVAELSRLPTVIRQPVGVNINELTRQVKLLDEFDRVSEEHRRLKEEVDSYEFSRNLEELRARKDAARVTGLAGIREQNRAARQFDQERNKLQRHRELSARQDTLKSNLPDRSVRTQLEQARQFDRQRQLNNSLSAMRRDLANINRELPTLEAELSGATRKLNVLIDQIQEQAGLINTLEAQNSKMKKTLHQECFNNIQELKTKLDGKLRKKEEAMREGIQVLIREVQEFTV